MSGRDEDGEPVADIPAEEERLLAGVQRTLAERAGVRTDAGAAGGPGGQPGRQHGRHSDSALIALRDEIGEARLEDVPALVAQMERLQEVSLTRAELQRILIDAASPYF